MKGSLVPGTLIDALHEIHDSRRTGVLHLMQHQQSRGLRFRGGEIVHGISSVPEEHMGEVLLRAFAERGGGYTFEEAESASAVDEGATLRLSPGEMILDVARRLQDADAIEHAVGDLDRVLAPAADPLLRIQKIALTPGDAYVLSRIDGTSKAKEIVELVKLPKADVLRSLFALLCARRSKS